MLFFIIFDLSILKSFTWDTELFDIKVFYEKIIKRLWYNMRE